MNALVLGAGGFIGSHLVNRLKSEGYFVRGVDLKRPEFSATGADEFVLADLRDPERVKAVVRLSDSPFSFYPQPFENIYQFDEVYQLAADMGGAGFVFTGENDADIMHNSALINLNVLDSLRDQKFKGKIFYSSSACIYPQEAQNDYHNSGLKEVDAYPASPDSDYGWEKLFSERLFLAYARNHGLDVRIARFHNIYGPEGTYKGGREKAPAAMCRKVLEAYNDFSINLNVNGDFNVVKEIEVWGTGHQTRSFLFIDDCVDAVRLLMKSSYREPINIGSEEMVTINDLAMMAIFLSGKDIVIKNIYGPTGVMGRNSDNELIEKELGWRPQYSLQDGLSITFDWIKKHYEP